MAEAGIQGVSGWPAARGSLRLFSPALPDLICLLTHLSAEACRAAVRLEHLPPELASQWREVLTQQNVLRVRIESHPTLGQLELNALCTSAAQTASHYELELKFHQLTPHQRAQFERALSVAQNANPPLTPSPLSPGGRGAGGEGAGAVSPARMAPGSALPPPDAKAPKPASGAPKPGAPPPPPPRSPTRQFRRIGEMLVQMGKLTVTQVEEAAARARASGEKLGQVLLRSGLVSPSVLCHALAMQAGLPMTDLEAEEIPEKLAQSFPLNLMTQYQFVPFDDAGAFLCIAAANALPPEAMKELEHACHKHIEVFLARDDLVHKELQALRHRLEAPPRLYIRYEAAYPVEYQFCTRLGLLAEQSSHKGTTVNVSEGGFLVEGPRIELGTPEEMLRVGMCATVLMVPGTAQEFRALCRIKSIKPQGERCTISLEILTISMEDRRRLKELCVGAIRAQASRPPD